KREYHSIRQTDTETSTEFMQRFLRLVGFLAAAAGTAEEHVTNAARNYEILHERDDDDSERPDKRNSGNGHDQRNRGQQSNRSINSGNSS
nr:hypothetical protein [Tanacetum cinerariifolium]